MLSIGNVVEVCSIVNEASTKLTLLLGQQVELRMIAPILPGINYDNSLIQQMDREIIINKIIHTVCTQYMINIKHLRGSQRVNHIPDARKMVAYLLKIYVAKIIDEEIAQILNMDRSTATYNRTQAEALLKDNASFRFNYNQVLIDLKKQL